MVDLNGNGLIDFSEWLVATSMRDEILSKFKLKQAFSYFDKRGTGAITLDNLREQMGSCGMKDNSVLDTGVLEDIIAECDENRDGKIDFDEFENMMLKMRNQLGDAEDKNAAAAYSNIN